MEIWLAANEDMIKVSELIHLYHLKESKDYGYYELVPWARRVRIMRGLPSSFRYWKSCFFFVSRDNFETPASKAWGDIPRLLHRWGTPHLGASIFSIVCWFLFCLNWSSITSFFFLCSEEATKVEEQVPGSCGEGDRVCQDDRQLGRPSGSSDSCVLLSKPRPFSVRAETY